MIFWLIHWISFHEWKKKETKSNWFNWNCCWPIYNYILFIASFLHRNIIPFTSNIGSICDFQYTFFGILYDASHRRRQSLRIGRERITQLIVCVSIWFEVLFPKFWKSKAEKIIHSQSKILQDFTYSLITTTITLLSIVGVRIIIWKSISVQMHR